MLCITFGTMAGKPLTIEEELMRDHSKKTWERIAIRAIKNPVDLEELMTCFFSKNYRLIQRSSQCLSKIHDLDHTVIAPYFHQIISCLNQESIDAYKRNTLRIFQDAEIPEDDQSRLFDLSLAFLLDKGEPIAIKAFAMTVLRKICEKYPELSGEVIHAIEIILEESPSPGIKNRGEKELNKLGKLYI